MRYVRKFAPGAPFESLDELAQWCRTGRYVFCDRWRQPKHGSWIMGFPLTVALSFLPQLRRAEVRPEWEAAEQQRRMAEA